MSLMEPARTPEAGLAGSPADPFSAGEGSPGAFERVDPTPVGLAQPDGSQRPSRPAPGDGTAGSSGRRLSIGAKFAILMTALLAVLLTTSLLLISQNRTTTREFEGILDREVAQGLIARELQVEYKKQVQEWKNILLRGSDREDLLRYTAAFKEQDAKTHDLQRQLMATDPGPELQEQLRRLVDLDRTADGAYDRALKAFTAGGGEDFASADRAVRGVDRAPTDLVDVMVADLEQRIAQRVAAQERHTAERHRLTLIVATGVLAAVASLLALALIRIVRPIRALTRQANRAAREQLPEAISRIKVMRAGEEPPTLPPFPPTTRDELRDLAEALTSLQSSALALAVEQHRADRETADMLVNLGRRNQNLLGRMLSYVTELERKEQNPDVLAQLFRLDHATTRIRRNAESMLVLAGATQTRTWSRPVPVIDVVRAALSEIEEYVRVDLHHIEDSLVSGSAVADVVHLIAELVENATHFSPPNTQVTVIGQRVREGYRLRVIDQGVGMTRRELDEANQRIQRAEGGWADSKLLGLCVVGRLARRRGIDIALEPSAGRGITASILLPDTVLGGPATPGPVPALPSAAQPEVTTLGAATAPDAGAPTHSRSLANEHVVEPDPSQAARDVPRPVVPRAAGGPIQPSAVIDLIEPMGAGGADAMATTGMSLPWFTREPSPSAPPVPSSPTSGRPPANAANGSRSMGVGAAAGSGSIPRRVRGAQLPDLGPAAEPVIARPDDGPGAAEALRWQLRSFQLDVQAARRAISEPAANSSQQHTHHDERSERNHGHHPEGE